MPACEPAPAGGPWDRGRLKSLGLHAPALRLGGHLESNDHKWLVAPAARGLGGWGTKHLIQAILPPPAMVKEKPDASRSLDAPMPPGRPNTLDRASSAFQASDESANPTSKGARDSDG